MEDNNNNIIPWRVAKNGDPRLLRSQYGIHCTRAEEIGVYGMRRALDLGRWRSS